MVVTNSAHLVLDSVQSAKVGMCKYLPYIHTNAQKYLLTD